MKKYDDPSEADNILEELFAINATHEQGGEWLGAARAWMQSNVPRGDTLTWGSNQPVTISFGSLERMALKVANAAVLAERRRMRGPGTPTSRFIRLMDELEERFPHPNPFDSTKAPERYMLEAIDKLIAAIDVSTPTGWIPWKDGNVRPTAGTKVVYKTLDGDTVEEACDAGDLDWSRSTFRPGDGWEIVAYKVVDKPTQPDR